MKKLHFILFPLALLLTGLGCEPDLPTVNEPSHQDNTLKPPAVACFMPTKVDIIPLTEFVTSHDGGLPDELRIYISLLDSFGSQIKSPAVFRFELYNAIPRSAEPKGERVHIWPDIDLTEPSLNNEYWRDFLRVYLFDLDIEQISGKNFVLLATCMTLDGKRLTDDFLLKLP